MGCFTPFYVKGAYVPCGKCYACRLNKRQAWCFRLVQEKRSRPNCMFVTFTYNEDSVPNRLFDKTHLYRYKTSNYMTLSKSDASQLIKDLQRNLRKLTRDKSLVRYYLIGEYGDKVNVTHGTNRPHYHAILYFPKSVTRSQAEEIVKMSWNKGFVDIDNVTFADINYVAKHQFKECRGNDYQRKFAPIFSTMTRYNGGLGSSYLPFLQRLHPSRNTRLYVLLNGYKIACPQFYRKRLFPDKMTDSEWTQFLINNSSNWHRKFAATFNIIKGDEFYSQSDYGASLYSEYRQLGFARSNFRWRQYVRKKFTRLYVKDKLKKQRDKNEYIRHIQSKKASA